MRRPFYIIGHNPNTISEVRNCLAAGANGIEPDICHDTDPAGFHMREQIAGGSHPNLRPEVLGLSLETYLAGLHELLVAEPSLELGLILFDLKPPYDYDINTLFDIIRRNFSALHPEVSIGCTVSLPNSVGHLGQLADCSDREAIGVDEATDFDVADAAFGSRPYIFADGTAAPLLPTTGSLHRNRVAAALAARDAAPDARCRFVYAWSVNSTDSMRTYLGMGVDGLITDNIPRLHGLITGPFAERFVLASRTHRPFAPRPVQQEPANGTTSGDAPASGVQPNEAPPAGSTA